MSLRVLFVEDSDDDAELMRRRLREAGLELHWDRVDTEPGLCEALRDAVWDVALVDFDLPGFGGPQALATLARLASEVPAITVSGAIDEDTAVATLTGGAVDYVLKDNLARLAPAVRRAVEGAELRRHNRVVAERSRLALFVTDQSPVGSVTLAPDGTVITANPAYARLRGVPEDGLIGQRVWDGIPSLSEDLWEDVRRAVRDAGSFEAEVELVRLDGERRVVDMLLSEVEYRDEALFIGWVRDVTQRRRAEEALEAEEANLAAVFEASPVAMMVLDGGLNVVRVNRATLELAEACDGALLEYDAASEVQCGAVLDCVHDRDVPRGCGFSDTCPLCPLRNALTALVADGVTVRGAEMAVDVVCDGDVRRLWLRVGAQPVAMDGSPHVVVALDDITETKRAEQALRESEELYRMLAETMRDVVWVLDVDERRFLYVSPSVERVRGYTVREVLDQAPEATVTADTGAVVGPRFLARAAEVRAEGPGRRLYHTDGVEQPCRDGSTTWSEIVTAWSVNASNGHVEVRGVSRDITQRRRAEEALRESEHRFVQFANHVPGELWIRDSERRYVYVNPALAAWFGVDAGSLLGKSPEETLDAKAAEVVRERCERAASGEVVDALEEWPGKDGPLWLRLRQFPIPTRDETMIGGLAFDVTEEQRTQAAVLKHAERLRRTVEGAVLAMGHVVETRDPYTAGHERRVAELAVAIGTELALPPAELEGLRLAALIHDIGKIAVPAEILAKPGRLSEVELNLIREHARAGYEILATIEFDVPVAEIVLQHHERLGGGGYPEGLAGEQILFAARVLAVADTVEAMSSHRPYRAALGMERALEEVRRGAGTDYDPAVAAACLRVVEEQGFVFTPESDE